MQDLASLQHIAHVKLHLVVRMMLRNRAGSWQRLKIRNYNGFEISFSDIDAFVRDNRSYLLVSSKLCCCWHSMCPSMQN